MTISTKGNRGQVLPSEFNEIAGVVNDINGISGITELTSVGGTDLLLIFDASSSYGRRRVQVSNLPFLSSTGGTLTGTLALGDASIKLNPSPTTDNLGNGMFVIGTFGEGGTISRVYTLQSDGKWWAGNAGQTTLTQGMMGLCTGTVTPNSTGNLLLNGFYRSDAWNWNVGSVIMLGTVGAGQMSQTIPGTTGEFLRVLGYAYSADVMYFNPDPTFVKRGA